MDRGRCGRQFRRGIDDSEGRAGRLAAGDRYRAAFPQLSQMHLVFIFGSRALDYVSAPDAFFASFVLVC